MKKTVTININGIIFNIDEDAFDKLNRYLNRVKAHFMNSDGRDEIIGDIEGRVAELLQEKLTELKQVITIEDIDEIIALMGEPAEFDDGAGQERDAGYKNTNRSKRLYRDPDNKMIAGISSGLGYYFNIDPAWFRGIFIISLLASGAGVIAYLIMWIVVPEARTTAEKLEMRGEPVNLSNIEASIAQEFEDLKGKFNDLTDEAKRTFKKKSNPTILETILLTIGSIFRIVFKVLLVVVGVLLVLSGFAFLVLLLGMSGMSSFSFFEHGELVGFSLPVLLQTVFSSRYISIFAVISVLLIVVVPVIMLIYYGLRMLIGNRIKVNYIGRAALGLWLLGLIMAAAVALNTSLEFRHTAIWVASEIRLPIAPNDTLYLDADGDNRISARQNFEIFDKQVQIDGDSYRVFARPDINFKTSDGYFVHVTAKAFAKGKSPQSAYGRAEEVHYNLTTSDTVLTFENFYSLPQNALIRDQSVRVRAEIPEGQFVKLSENMRKLLNSDWWFYHKHKAYSGQMWVMTEDGLTPYEKE